MFEMLCCIVFYELGYVLVVYLFDVGSVECVSIELCGLVFGVIYVMCVYEEFFYGECELWLCLVMMFVGCEVELIVFGNVFFGVVDDFKCVLELVINMVGLFGFGKIFGLFSMVGVLCELIGFDV